MSNRSGGGMSVLLQKTPSRLEAYNDLDGDIVNFFRVLRERPDDPVRVIYLTPFSRKELNCHRARSASAPSSIRHASRTTPNKQGQRGT